MEARTRPQNYGSFFTLAAGFLAAVNGLIFQMLSGPTYLQTMLGSQITQITCVVLYLLLFAKREKSVFSGLNLKVGTLIILRAGLQVAAGMMFMASQKQLPLGDFSALTGTSSVITGILGIIFLGESWQLIEVIVSVCCWVGVVCIAKPAFLWGESGEHAGDDNRSFYVTLCLTATAISCFLVLAIRKISGMLDSVQQMFLCCLANSVLLLVVMAAVEDVAMPPTQSLKFLGAVGLLDLTVQLLFIRGLETEKAAAAVISHSSAYIVTSFVFQIVILQTIPGLSSVVGTAMISLSTAFLTWQKTQHSEKTE